MLVPLLLALLADRAEAPLGTMRELRGRLGISPEPTPSTQNARTLLQATVQEFLRQFPGTDAERQTFRLVDVARSLRVFSLGTEPERTDLLLAWAFREDLEGRWTPTGADSIRDWWEAAHPDLGRFSAQEAHQAAIRWHAALIEYSKTHAGQAVPPGQVVMSWPDGWSVHLLRGPDCLDALHQEGKSMQNCLGDGGYDEEVKSGHVWIYSLRRPPDTLGWSIPVVTLAWEWGMRHQALMQRLTAFWDAVKLAPSEKAKALVQKWGDTAGEVLLDDPVIFLNFVIHLYGDCGFTQIRGRQNMPPHPRYQARVRELLEFLLGADLGQADSHGSQNLKRHIAECVWMITPEDEYFHEVWADHDYTEKIFETWFADYISLTPEQWRLYLGEDRILQIVGTLAEEAKDEVEHEEEYHETLPEDLADLIARGGQEDRIKERVRSLRRYGESFKNLLDVLMKMGPTLGVADQRELYALEQAQVSFLGKIVAPVQRVVLPMAQAFEKATYAPGAERPRWLYCPIRLISNPRLLSPERLALRLDSFPMEEAPFAHTWRIALADDLRLRFKGSDELSEEEEAQVLAQLAVIRQSVPALCKLYSDDFRALPDCLYRLMDLGVIDAMLRPWPEEYPEDERWRSLYLLYAIKCMSPSLSHLPWDTERDLVERLTRWFEAFYHEHLEIPGHPGLSKDSYIQDKIRNLWLWNVSKKCPIPYTQQIPIPRGV